MDRRNHPVKEKKYEKQEINGNYRVPLYVCVGFVRLWFYGRKRTLPRPLTLGEVALRKQ